MRCPGADIFVIKIFFIFELSQKPLQYLFVIRLSENAEYVHQDRNINLKFDRRNPSAWLQGGSLSTIRITTTFIIPYFCLVIRLIHVW